MMTQNGRLSLVSEQRFFILKLETKKVTVAAQRHVSSADQLSNNAHGIVSGERSGGKQSTLYSGAIVRFLG